MIAPAVTAAATTPVAKTPAASAAAPAAAAAPADPAPVLSAYERCQAAATANPAGDQDSDGLPTSTEHTRHLDPCVADSDGDGMVNSCSSTRLVASWTSTTRVVALPVPRHGPVAASVGRHRDGSETLTVAA